MLNVERWPLSERRPTDGQCDLHDPGSAARFVKVRRLDSPAKEMASVLNGLFGYACFDGVATSCGIE